MMLLAQAITQKFSTPTNNHLRTSSNIRNQAVIYDGRLDIQTTNTGYCGNGNRNAGRQNRNQAFNAGTGNDESNQIKPRVRDAKYFREQMLLAMKDDARSNLKDEENDFMLDNSYGDETLEELTAAVYAATRVHEQVNRVQSKTLIYTSNDDPIDSNIIFYYPYVENNGGTSEHDSIAHDEYHDIKMLEYNYKETYEELEREIRADKDTIERILKENDKTERLGYKNPESLKKDSASQPKMYDGERLHSTSLKIHSSDSEETLEDTKESVESSNSVKRPKSKDNKSNNRVLKNTNDKRPCAHVRKMSSSVSIDSNKRKTMHSNVYQSNTSVLNTKIVNAVKDSSNIICVSYGKDVFILSHEKCVARYALSRDSKVKRALFTTPIATKSKNLGATSVVAKSRLSVAKTLTATNKVSSDPARPLDFRFGNDHFAVITGYGDYVQGNLTIFHVYYVEGLGHNLFSVRQFCDGDLEVAFCSDT
ncbi:hypothetical protein Tco_0973916 [Tanacetum coccineum]|uniref:Integrase, catalytic region, zinc finger, CCHC-type, peptidase aspartic, catalytic n=1 Tax=Tanacetum coccineum TaxID=301880 RepID=A0ABQ5EA30_9ASTR